MVFSRLFHRLQIPVGLYRQAALDVFGDIKIKVKSASISQLSPGDLITFQYNNEWLARRHLVVGCQRGDGNFVAEGTGNWLLTAYEINETVGSMWLLFHTLYKNRIAARYKRPRPGKVGPHTAWFDMPGVTNKLLGYYNFRTFNISKVKNLYEIQVLPEEQKMANVIYGR